MDKSKPGVSAFFARIEGRVQGVGFRYNCRNEGQRLKLTGWVRNTPEGGVEVWAEGPKEKLDAMLLWLHNGPPGSRVDKVDYDMRTPGGTNKRFKII